MARHETRCDLRQHCGGNRPPHRARAILVGIISLAVELISATAAAAAPNLVSVVVRGSTVYDAPTLFDGLSRAARQTRHGAGARAIAAALLAKYESDGYSRPQIKLDDSLLEVGVLRIDLLEPRIAEVRVNGDPGPHLERLETLGSKLREDGPITQAGVETALRQMRALPGLTLQATTARDETSTHLYRLDLDTQFDRTTRRRALEQPRHRRGRAELRARPSHGQRLARRADEPRRDVRRSDRLRGISRARLARQRRRRRGRRPAFVQRFSLALESARAHRRSRRRLFARSRVDRLRAAVAGLRAGEPVCWPPRSTSTISRSCARGERLRDERLRMLTRRSALGAGATDASAQSFVGVEVVQGPRRHGQRLARARHRRRPASRGFPVDAA